jgi:hypothetical protein
MVERSRLQNCCCRVICMLPGIVTLATTPRPSYERWRPTTVFSRRFKCSEPGWRPGAISSWSVRLPPGVELTRKELFVEGTFGGREGIRTPGLLVANEALSQLSYSPTSSQQNFNKRPTACQHSVTHSKPARPQNLRPASYSPIRPAGSYGWSSEPPVRCAMIFRAF